MKITFILVEPARAENIGAAARAIKTMGFTRLRLVGTRPSEAARWVAHASGEILDHASCYDTLFDALRDVDFSVAATARRRMQHDDYLSPAECARAVHGKSASLTHAALVFGRESSGLTGQEIALCDAATRIPLPVPQPSLNLAQAVMLYAWELYKADAPCDPGPNQEAYSVARSMLADGLERLGLSSHPRIRRWADEGLSRFSDRDLGMLMQILRRLP